MQAVAAELSGYAGKLRCFLGRKIQKQFVDSFILKHALYRLAESVEEPSSPVRFG
jgi:hypothetical protein